jgi:hypothetical protein
VFQELLQPLVRVVDIVKVKRMKAA